jgi:hypothetical protein
MLLKSALKMVEVFKTNITCPEKAMQLVEAIHQNFAAYTANFDLDDCDRILRVLYGAADKPALDFIEWLYQLGCTAEALPDF